MPRGGAQPEDELGAGGVYGRVSRGDEQELFAEGELSKVVLGQSGGKNVHLDLDVLLRTRLLIQANSGKGKSWLLRRLAEQLFGKVPVIIVDPEGEFATLREKFDYVLVGKGGETPADVRSARLVANRLLELRAYAVCDIYEMKPATRHEWVRTFLEAMVDAPKELWRPTVVILDEAHVFCPEKGAGESEASEAVISMATRGRKRGFCLVAATQRLGKFRKDAAAEMLNVLIGGTFIDIDRKRAADALGVYGKDVHGFFDEIRLLPRGQFYSLGPAVATERVLLEVGPVQTTHPEAGSAKHAADAPPAPEKVKALLPKLADLPKQAEEKAKTEAELRTEIRSLKAQLKQGPAETKEVRVADEKAIERAVRAAEAQYKQIVATTCANQRKLLAHGARLAKDLCALAEAASKAFSGSSQEVPQFPARNIPKFIPAKPATPAQPITNYKSQSTEKAHSNGDAPEVSKSQMRILKALAELEAIGKEQPSRETVAAWSQFRPTGGGFNNYLGGLRTLGLVDYPAAGSLRLTEEGREMVGAQHAPETDEIFRRVESLLNGKQREMLKVLRERTGEAISREELAERVSCRATGGGFNNYLGNMRTMGIIEYPAQGQVKCAEWLFTD